MMRGANGNEDTAQPVASTSRLPSKQTIHIEVRLHPESQADPRKISKLVRQWLFSSATTLECETLIDPLTYQSVPHFVGHVQSIRITEGREDHEIVFLNHVHLAVHTYRPESTDIVEDLSADPDGEEGQMNAATVTELPSAGLEGVWESLIYADDVKRKLLRYIKSTLLFADAAVDANVIACNRVVLLHGPPGTGKTTLCRALAQKLSIRLSSRFDHGKLVEINSHSLFSKWFSESGKLVQSLFEMVTEMVQDESGFVVILIDEVESLTAARNASSKGGEPGDAVRVVNAVLTQLDKLKQRKNVLVMCTSNISESIDAAFIDRADIKQYIGPPPPKAIYWILKDCLEELMKKGLVQKAPLLQYHDAVASQGQGLRLDLPVTSSATRTSSNGPSDPLAAKQLVETTHTASIELYRLAQACEGISGRALRRVPLLAYAHYLVELEDGLDEEDEEDEGTTSINADGKRRSSSGSNHSSSSSGRASGTNIKTSSSSKKQKRSRRIGLTLWVEAMKKAVDDSRLELELTTRGSS